MPFPPDSNIHIERHMARTEAQLELLSIRLQDLESQLDKNDSITDKVKLEMSVLREEISQIDNNLHEVKAKTGKLANNVFLQFTSEMTSQKLITIILVLSTAVSSPTLITSWLNGSLPDQESERIDRLIDLLQENAQSL